MAGVVPQVNFPGGNRTFVSPQVVYQPGNDSNVNVLAGLGSMADTAGKVFGLIHGINAAGDEEKRNNLKTLMETLQDTPGDVAGVWEEGGFADQFATQLGLDPETSRPFIELARARPSDMKMRAEQDALLRQAFLEGAPEENAAIDIQPQEAPTPDVEQPGLESEPPLPTPVAVGGDMGGDAAGPTLDPRVAIQAATEDYIYTQQSEQQPSLTRTYEQVEQSQLQSIPRQQPDQQRMVEAATYGQRALRAWMYVHASRTGAAPDANLVALASATKIDFERALKNRLWAEYEVPTEAVKQYMNIRTVDNITTLTRATIDPRFAAEVEEKEPGKLARLQTLDAELPPEVRKIVYPIAQALASAGAQQGYAYQKLDLERQEAQHMMNYRQGQLEIMREQLGWDQAKFKHELAMESRRVGLSEADYRLRWAESQARIGMLGEQLELQRMDAQTKMWQTSMSVQADVLKMKTQAYAFLDQLSPLQTDPDVRNLIEVLSVIHPSMAVTARAMAQSAEDLKAGGEATITGEPSGAAVPRTPAEFQALMQVQNQLLIAAVDKARNNNGVISVLGPDGNLYEIDGSQNYHSIRNQILKEVFKYDTRADATLSAIDNYMAASGVLGPNRAYAPPQPVQFAVSNFIAQGLTNMPQGQFAKFLEAAGIKDGWKDHYAYYRFAADQAKQAQREASNQQALEEARLGQP